MRQDPDRTMMPYWSGVLIGLFGTTAVACYLNGCGGTMMGSIAIAVTFIFLSGLGDSLFLIGGLQHWRDKVCEAGWPRPFLFVVGWIVGAAAPVMALALLHKPPKLQNFFLPYMIALGVFVLGPVILSWIAIFLLSRAKGRVRPDYPPEEASP